jgi:hypothetical protein
MCCHTVRSEPVESRIGPGPQRDASLSALPRHPGGQRDRAADEPARSLIVLNAGSKPADYSAAASVHPPTSRTGATADATMTQPASCRWDGLSMVASTGVVYEGPPKWRLSVRHRRRATGRRKAVEPTPMWAGTVRPGVVAAGLAWSGAVSDFRDRETVSTGSFGTGFLLRQIKTSRGMVDGARPSLSSHCGPRVGRQRTPVGDLEAAIAKSQALLAPRVVPAQRLPVCILCAGPLMCQLAAKYRNRFVGIVVVTFLSW